MSTRNPYQELPAMMQAVSVPHPGAAENMTLSEVPKPDLQEGEVLIKVLAAGVNRPDILQRQGNYPAPKGASEILGLEVAGIIVRSKGTRYKPGDEVCALLSGGGYAGYANVHETNCLPVPKGLSMVQAASLPETYFTVWSNIFDRAGLKAGEIFLVHGGSSGIGVAAIQLAKAFGARVFATAGSAEKCAACERLGAEKAINYLQEDYVSVLKETCGGVDVILDMVGGDYIDRNIAACRKDGRIVNIAFLNGASAEVNFLPVMLKRLTLTGSTLRIRSTAFKAQIAKELEEKVWPLIEAGEITPVLDKIFPLSEVSQAHERMEASAHIGKIMLEIDHP